MKKKKIKCCICNSVIVPGNNPYTGLPNGVGLQMASGKIYNVCSKCVSYRNDEVNEFVMAEEAKAGIKTEEFPYRLYKDGEEPPVYCLRCGKQLTKIDKDGVKGKSHPYIVLMIDRTNLNGHYGIAAMCDECVLATPRSSDTAELRERKKREWHRKARANYVAKNRDKIRENAREYYRSKHPGCKIRGEYKHKEA